MKCQQCEKPATFHITELTKPEAIQEVHLCEDCAREYLAKQEQEQLEPEVAQGSLAGALAQQFKVNQTAEELAQLDQRSCPKCGITFYEFRHVGRLGCPYDYVCFEEELEPLIINIHGETAHRGKRPAHGGAEQASRQADLIGLRREMRECVEQEAYEKASQLLNKIRELEAEQGGPAAEGEQDESDGGAQATD